VALRSEVTIIGALFFSFFKLSGNSQNEKSFCVNLRYLNVSMRISVKEKLTRDSLWELLEELSCCILQFWKDKFLNITLEFISKDIIDLRNEFAHLGDKLDETFWY